MIWSPQTPSQRDLEEYERQRAALRPPQWEVGPPPESSLPPQQETGAPDESTLAAAPIAPPQPSPAPWELGDDFPAADPEASVRVPALAPQPSPMAQVTNRQTAASETRSPVAAAATKPRPTNDAAYDVGPEPRSKLGTLLASLPQHVGNIVTAATNPQAGLPFIQQGVAATGRAAQEDRAARVAFGNRKRHAERNRLFDDRRARLDQEASEDRQRRIKGEEAAAKLSAEARDPNSQKNQIFRASIQKEYPDIWGGLTPEQQQRLTIEDAHALKPAIEGEQRKRETQQKLDEETRSENRQRRLIDYRRKPRGGGGSAYSSPPGQDSEVLQAITAAFEGKVPPEVSARVKLAQAIRDPQKRAAKLDQILHQAGQQATAGKTAEAKTQEADFKETREYQNKMEGLRNARRTVTNLRAALKNYTKTGPDGKMQHAGKDVPGYGRFASHLPDVAISDEGQGLRSMVRDYVSQLVLARSGKAATDTERRYLESVLGVSPGMSEEQLVAALERMEAMNAETEKDLTAAYHHARAARDANRPGATRETDPEDEWEDVQ